MRHRPPPTARRALVLALAPALLAGCAEMHHGVEAVGRIGSSPVPAEAADAAPASRPDIKTVRPRGAPRAPASDAAAAEPAEARALVASAVPSPRQIFDFHPAGSRPDSWRQPFVIDTGDGPLAADVRRSAAELKAFMADHARTDAARLDRTATGTTGTRCGEMDVAAKKPGCTVPRPAAAAAPAVP